MKKSVNARFAIKTWNEQPYSEGEGQVEYLMMYRSDGSATFVGLERVVGRIGGKTGAFVLQRTRELH
jgi:hypothetical protein